jgi:hypothetical protein
METSLVPVTDDYDSGLYKICTRSADFCTRPVRDGHHDRDHERCRRYLCADHVRGLLRVAPQEPLDAGRQQAEEDLTMDMLAVVLGLVMFAVLYVLIFGIERI